MNRADIKEKARQIVNENLKEFWIGFLILLGITFLISFGIELLLEKRSIIYNCLSIVSSFFSMTLSVGFYSYLLKMIRKEEYERSDLFKYIGNIFPIIAMSLLVAIFTFLGCILLIIPGIIIALSFSFVYLLYVEDSTKLPMDYLEESKEMIKGYKWDYFVFQISFLSWILLSIITFGIALIWVLPYISIADVLYYDELKQLKEKDNVDK